ncbi:alpha/beta hydrolase [Terrimonas sp. NA20]|uniref:Alpha/beta hydrolase n=1 Tax=Terrimonas ginsenosidimutans TaxID=2908004 RepID=A0ABS9KUJ9_9BACT|nr:alpha/beta hydrolase [Terrimonas ginsenosidimutans]MCG2616024.1 alpha/beta hydrolase [Terrimonas ginsenosidimutans]
MTMFLKPKVTGILLSLCLSQIIFAQQGDFRSASVDGKKISYKLFNPEGRKENDPILVFEHGIGGGSFEQLFRFLPKTISGIQYDRNGLGQSEADTNITTDAQVTERLHELLHALDIQPPYLLVGHSVGGAYIRLFTARFPKEVCGLVFIDPTDFMLSSQDDAAAKRRSESLTSYQQIWTLNLQTMSREANVPEGVKNDAKRALKASTPSFFQEYRDLPLLINIPATVIISYNKPIEPYEEEMNKTFKLGINIKQWWREYDEIRIKNFSDLIRENDNSRVVLLTKYSHGVHFQDPQLVAALILENYDKCSKNHSNKIP